jgi:hypothetical protein
VRANPAKFALPGIRVLELRRRIVERSRAAGVDRRTDLDSRSSEDGRSWEVCGLYLLRVSFPTGPRPYLALSLLLSRSVGCREGVSLAVGSAPALGRHPEAAPTNQLERRRDFGDCRRNRMGVIEQRYDPSEYVRAAFVAIAVAVMAPFARRRSK